jgi:hypothetical protein
LYGNYWALLAALLSYNRRNSRNTKRIECRCDTNGVKNSHRIYFDRDFNLLRVNETYLQTRSYKPDEMIDKNCFLLDPRFAMSEMRNALMRDRAALDRGTKFLAPILDMMTISVSVDYGCLS